MGGAGEIHTVHVKNFPSTPSAEQHEFPKPHHDEGCMKCGGFAGEPCEPPRHLVSELERGSVFPGRPNRIALATYIRSLEAQNAKMREALEEIAKGTNDESVNCSGDYLKGLMCGVEDDGLQSDGYGGASYGFENGRDRAMEWAQGISKTALSPTP